MPLHDPFTKAFLLSALGVVALAAGGACGSDSAGAPGADIGDGGLDGSTTPGEGGSALAHCNAHGDLLLAWARPVATGGSPGAMDVAKDGTIRMTGTFASGATAPFTFGAGGPHETKLSATLETQDVWVAKLDADGAVLWAKGAGGTDADSASAVAAADDGSTRVLGTFKGTAVFGRGEPGEIKITSGGEQSTFIAKYDADGAVSWVKQAGGGGTARVYQALVAGDGSLRVVGTLEGTVTFGAGEPNQTMLTAAAVNTDFFLAKLDAGGALSWVKRLHAPSAGPRIGLFPDGGLLLSSASNVQTTLAIGEANETKVAVASSFFAKYDPDGKLGTVTTTSGLPPADLSLGADGGWTIVGTLFPTGSASETVTFGKGEANETSFTGGPPDFFIARYGADGKVAWAKRAGDAVGKDHGLRVGVAPDGTSRVLGTYSPSTSPILGPGELGAVKLPTSACAGTRCDIPFLANYAADGTVITGKRLSAQAPTIVDLAVLADGSLRIGGNFTDKTTLGEGEPGAVTLNGGGIYVARYDVCP